MIVTTAIACLIAVDLWVRVMQPVLREYDDNPYRRTAESLRRRGMTDIVLMGSSRSSCGLAPDDFEAATGKSAFNAAVSASGVVEWQLLARQLFAVERPRLVVLGINADELRDGYVPRRAARYLFNRSDLLEHLRKDHPSRIVVGDYFRRCLGPAWALFDNRFETKMWLLERSTPALPKHAQLARKLRERVTRTDPGDGGFGVHSSWVKRLPTLKDRLAVDPTPAPAFLPPAYSPDADAIERLTNLLDWFHEHRIAVLVVYIPNSPLTEERWRGIEPMMTDAIADLCRGHGLPFLRCDPEDLPRTNADFINEFHVGLPLAHQISRRAARQIITLGLLNREDRHFARSRDVAAAAGYGSRGSADPADSPK